jgi:hypothetical protein
MAGRMEHICERCGRKYESLITIDYAHSSVQYTEIMGQPYTGTDHVCIDCARTILDMSSKDIITEERRRARDAEYMAAALRSRLAQSVVSTVLEEFGYEVYPYTMEAQLAPVLRQLRQKDQAAPMRKLGGSPDLFVLDREPGEGRLVEVLDAEVTDEARFWASRFMLSSLRDRWPESVLMIYCMPSMNIYARVAGSLQIESFPVEHSPLSGRFHCVMDLKRDLGPPEAVFKRIDPRRHYELMKRLRAAILRSVSLTK